MSSITGGDGKGTVDKDMDVEDRDTEEHMLKMLEVEGTHTEEERMSKRLDVDGRDMKQEHMWKRLEVEDMNTKE
jgi:hypothetical protein